ncbi:MAG: hypothetical protein JO362_07905 [Streptomycetaceae bacterium]|nr:hypothetical protein [Streptomycetaceae bacterium]
MPVPKASLPESAPPQREQIKSRPAEEGTVLYRYNIEIPTGGSGEAWVIADGQFRVPAGPDQQAAAERVAADKLRALFKTEAERRRPVPEGHQRDYVIHAVGPGGQKQAIRITGRTLHHTGDAKAKQAEKTPTAGHNAPAAEAEQTPAPPQRAEATANGTTMPAGDHTTYRWKITVPGENKEEILASGEFQVAAGPGEREALKALATERVSKHVPPGMPDHRAREVIISAVGPKGWHDALHVRGDEVRNTVADPAVSADVRAEAENAARMARMASPGPVDAALPQQKAERPAVSGKVVRHQGQDLTQRRGGPRPGR